MTIAAAAMKVLLLHEHVANHAADHAAQKSAQHGVAGVSGGLAERPDRNDRGRRAAVSWKSRNGSPTRRSWKSPDDAVQSNRHITQLSSAFNGEADGSTGAFVWAWAAMIC